MICRVSILFFPCLTAPIFLVSEGTFSFKYTNKIQRHTIFFITVNAVHVSGGFSAHHQELKTVHTTSGIGQACSLLTLAVAASKLDLYQTVIKNIV